MEETPEDLDWVNKRADCELEEAFQKLSEAVENDVKLYNSRFDPEIAQAPVFQKETNYPTFSVHRKRHIDVLWVTFHKKADRIEIEDQCGAQTLNAIPLLAPNGRCKFRVQVGEEKTEMERWQLQRAALEGIFFAPVRR